MRAVKSQKAALAQVIHPELEQIRLETDRLTVQLAEAELELEMLRANLTHFETRYLRALGPHFVELDELEAEIAALRASISKGSKKARLNAEAARARAEQTRGSVSDAGTRQDRQFKPAESLKSLYRRVVSALHPDRAQDDDDRKLRNRLMAAANRAFAEGNEAALRAALEDYELQRPAMADILPEERVSRARRQIERIHSRLRQVRAEIITLLEGDLYQLMQQVEAEEREGRDPWGRLIEAVRGRIAAAQSMLEELKNSLPRGGVPKARTSPARETTAPYPEGRIHRTERGEKVRSKSQVIIANALHQVGIDYRYEQPLTGQRRGGQILPAFVVLDGDGQPIVWEHLEDLGTPERVQEWEERHKWYEANGFMVGINLFVTRDEPDGGLDSRKIRKLAEFIKSQLG